MKHNTLAGLSFATTLGLFAPLPVHAFGLGQITLQSALNEPFRAEIAVNALRDDERGNLEVRLASTQDFERAGLDRSFLLTQLNFEVVEDATSTRILVTSDVPIKEPFLGFLLAATTGQGKMLREYTVLLDPPKELYRGRSSSGTLTESSSLSPTQAASPVSPRASTTASGGVDNISSYRVTSRDTLWSIAEKTRPSADITMQQMMIALLNANPQAFQQNNVNSLYANSTLQIPGRDTITRISPIEAKTAIDQQNLAWRNRNQPQRAQTVPVQIESNESESDANAESSQIESSDESTATANDTVGSASEEAETARLKLVAATENTMQEAEPDMSGDPDLQRISEQLTLAQETIEAQSQENIDFKNRMDALERQLETMRRLISLKDADMARLQSLLEQDETQTDLATLVDEANAILQGSDTTEMASESVAENATQSESESWQPVAIESELLNQEAEKQSATGELNVAESDLTETGAPEPNNSVSDSIVSAENNNMDSQDELALQTAEQSNGVDESDSSIESDVSTEAESVEADNNDVQSELDQSLADVESAIDETGQMLGLDEQQMTSLYHRVQAFVIAHKVESLLAVLLLLLLIWMVIRRSQREVSWDDAVSKINKNKSTETTPETKTINPVTPVVSESEPTYVNPVKSVDELVEQADMFVGYADYVQARTALEQAHQQAPEDKAISAKLLFVYFKQQKSADFISLLHNSGIEETDPQWTEVRNWGHQLLPHNPWFAEDEAIAETSEEAFEQPITDDAVEEVTELSEDEADSAEDKDDHIEFNLDDYQTAQADPDTTETSYERDDEDMLPFDTDYQSETVSNDVTKEDESESASFPEDDDLRIDFDHDNVLEPDASAPQVLDLDIEDEREPESIESNITESDLTLDAEESDTLDLTELETEQDTTQQDDEIIEDYLNLDNSLEDDELDFDLSDFDSIDEAETKLDLAAAYSDMGDPDGARGILQEVLEQGTDEQKQRAQELLDSLS